MELKSNDKIPKRILEMMQNHKESQFWFTSLIGLFYQFGFGCDPDRKRAMESYLLAINNEKDEFDTLRNKNIIIGKYLLSLFHYRDIILDMEGFNYNQSKKETEIIKLVRLAKNGDSEAQHNLAKWK